MNNLTIIEKNGLRVLTTAQLAESYGTEPIKIHQNFSNNRNRYTEGKHFFLLQGEELQSFLRLEKIELQNSSKIRSLYLWTEKGAWLHAKSLNTDEAWEAYELLVDEYYNIKQAPLSPLQMIHTMTSEMMKHEERLNLLETKVEEQITLDHGEQRRVQKAIAIRVYEESGDKNRRSELFAELYREIRDRFGVASYRDLKRKDMQLAIRYIEGWIPKKGA